MDGCPGLVVMGEHSRSEGHVFESQHIISLMLVKIVMFVLKMKLNEKDAVDGTLKNILSR